MAAAKKRLEQISSQIQPGQASASEPFVGVSCQTREHSPGHHVATITFSNPTKLNVANADRLDQLIHTCQELSKDEKLRAVVLTGAPPVRTGQTPSFIGGADIQELNRLNSSDDAKAYITRVHNACAAIQAIPVPVVARVHGFALGAGLELMAACDLRIASQESKFGMPEVKIGLPSVAEAALFPALIGLGRTKRLIYLAENISADTALEWGLVERVVKNEADLNKGVEEWISTIVGMGPESMRVQKRLITKWEKAATIDEAVQAGVGALGESYADGGKQAKEYMKPFLGRKR